MSVYRLDVTFSRWLVERLAPPLVRVGINPYAHAGIWPHRGLKDNVELELNRAGRKANLSVCRGAPQSRPQRPEFPAANSAAPMWIRLVLVRGSPGVVHSLQL